jgi:uncharacterized protein (DUF2235 family)
MSALSTYAMTRSGLLEIIPPAAYRDEPDVRVGKNIVICADGTGNADVKGRGSNVFKLFEAIDKTSHLHSLDVPRQIAFYHEGVGTESWWPARVVDTAFGTKVETYVCDLYEELSRVYEPDDRLYLFGFSRGAFTVRALAGLIDRCGVLVASEYRTNEALRAAVENCSAHFLRGGRFDGKVHVPRPETPIEFIGAWDTVDAIGLPFAIAAERVNARYPYKALVGRLPKSVRCACQALALDEPRQTFAPVLWDEDDRAEQVWFSGAHSDIGGGYPRQGLSLISLRWMMERARARGLRFNESDAAYCDQHQTYADALHDPRTGTGLFYRWKPRDVVALCRTKGVQAAVHVTVLERTAQAVEGYSPINLPVQDTSAPGPDRPTSTLTIAFTERRDWEHLDPAAIERTLHEATRSLLTAAEASIVDLSSGVRSYWLFVAGSVTAVVSMTIALLAVLVMTVDRLLRYSIPSQIEVTAGVFIAVFAVALVLLRVAWKMADRTDRAYDQRYSKLWRDVRPDLLRSLARSAAGIDYARAAVSQAGGGVVSTAARVSSP